MDCSQLNAIPWASINKIVDPETPQFGTLTCVKTLVNRGLCPKDHPPPIRRDEVCSEIALKLPALDLLGLLRWDANDVTTPPARSRTYQMLFAIPRAHFVPHVQIGRAHV